MGMEGVLHLSDVQIVKLPPWGHQQKTLQGSVGSVPKGLEAPAAAKDTTSESNWVVDYIDGVDNEAGNTPMPSVPWQRDTPPAPAPSDPAALLSDLLHASEGTRAGRRQAEQTNSGGDAVQRRGMDSAAANSKGYSFPW